MKKQWIETKFGEAPLSEVKIVNFSFKGPKSRDETAFVQYNLLLNENILQLHLEHSTGKGIAVVVSDFDFCSEVKKAGLLCHSFSEKKLAYEELLAKNNTF